MVRQYLSWTLVTEVSPGLLVVRQYLRWIVETQPTPWMSEIVQMDLVRHQEDDSAFHAVVRGTDTVFLPAGVALPIETRLLAACFKHRHTARAGEKQTRNETVISSSFFLMWSGNSEVTLRVRGWG